jgi:hypothetical protein
MTENRFQGQYKKVGSSKVSEQDKRLLHTSNKEIRVYLSGGQAAPEGRDVREGSGGGRYYVTQKQTRKTTPKIEGAQKMVRVTGDGIGIVAGIVDGNLKVKSLKNQETGAFIKKVIAAGGSEDKPGQFLAAMKEIGKKMDLNVSA